MKWSDLLIISMVPLTHYVYVDLWRSETGGFSKFWRRGQKPDSFLQRLCKLTLALAMVLMVVAFLTPNPAPILIAGAMVMGVHLVTMAAVSH